MPSDLMDLDRWEDEHYSSPPAPDLVAALARTEEEGGKAAELLSGGSGEKSEEGM